MKRCVCSISLISAVMLLPAQNLQPDYKIGKHTVSEWQYIVDTTWGEGLGTDKELEIFDYFWDITNDTYPNFSLLNVDWSSYKTFRNEIFRGVSRGRMSAIIGQMFMALQDAHLFFTDNEVVRTPLKAGVPLIKLSGYWNVDHFGAGLTPLPDSTVFVYEVVENHPMGLELGDKVLGYDGKAWKNIYKDLLNLQLPFVITNLPEKFDRGYNGTSPLSFTHTWLSAAGMNWHLFDTIDIVKYKSGDTLHLPTSLLEGKEMKLFADGQLDLPGINPVDTENKNNAVSWGVIEGKDIGYIRSYSWMPLPYGWAINPGIPFYNALTTFLDDPEIKGVIIDHRLAEGGLDQTLQTVYMGLFNTDYADLVDYDRIHPGNYLLKMSDFDFYIRGSDHFFDKPVAVLTGPAAKSMGDIFPYIMKSHPMSRSFGLPTNGAFGIAYFSSKKYEDHEWSQLYTITTQKDTSRSDTFLTFQDMWAEDSVWLNQESVAMGIDNVVEKAKEWIESVSYLYDPSFAREYIAWQSDTVKIKAYAKNPTLSELRVHVICYNLNSERLDSAVVYQGIPEAVDSIEVNYISQQEDICEIDLYTTNLLTGEQTGYTRALSFSTYKDMLEMEGNIWGFSEAGHHVTLGLTISNLTKYESGKVKLRIEGLDEVSDIDTSINIDGIQVGEPFNQTVKLCSQNFSEGMTCDLKISYTDNQYFSGADTITNLLVLTSIENDFKQDLAFTMFPNPAKDLITINPGVEGNYSVSIYSVTGQLVYTKHSSDPQIRIDLTPFRKGIYFVCIRSDGRVKTQKMVKY